MTTDDRTARLSTPADEQPTVDLGASAVLTEERPSAGERPAADESASSQQARAPYGTPAVPPAALAPAPSTPFSLTSLILGVTSVFFGLTVIAPAAGLVFGILGLRREPSGRTLSIWGIVLNSVMLGLVLLFAIAVLVVVVLVPLAALASGSDYR
ncbi:MULTISPECIES: DUF4190 domain-containing protein [unclassified Rathayibacter]|uniref:DUF4190 domain-containing protein n=1 Tax=unclassified Rathayibacter TaxID=2609250 RepID=UPI000CE919C0|nr:MULTISPECIES: DUF4190 domain-containing protein [unclassified Rathayibacter]PPG05327.1 DUF4190 domain-containing protein [Rathayibacter sp. AY2B1]PPG73481.1 DUF4190 domain-containing protein [Rathayibacter sp. AY1F4]